MDASTSYCGYTLNAYATQNCLNQVIPIDDLNSEQLRNLLLEAFEISFVKCNERDTSYNFLTIIEMVKQIIPTAFVIGTSYWVLYNSKDFKITCVCKAYNLECPHTRGATDWIQIPALKESKDFALINRANHEISVPKNFTMETRSDNKTINIFLSTNLHIYKFQGVESHLQRTTPFYTCHLEFAIIPQLSPHYKLQSLFPHPHSWNYHGSIFHVLRERCVHLTEHGNVQWTPNTMKADSKLMPKVTLVVRSCSFFRVPVYKELGTIYNGCKECLGSHRDLDTLDQQTQTEEPIVKLEY